MIASAQDVMVYTAADFDRLPDDGIFEVVDGRAVLMPGNDWLHQAILMALINQIQAGLGFGQTGFVVPTANIFIPRLGDALSEVQNRVPDIVVCRQAPRRRFTPGQPPEWVLEILSTRRGNVERTEKMDDYALAGISEYWIVDSFGRQVEQYTLQARSYYILAQQLGEGRLQSRAFPEVAVDLNAVWSSLPPGE